MSVLMMTGLLGAFLVSEKTDTFFKLQVLNFEISICRNQHLILTKASINRFFVFWSGYRAKENEVFVESIFEKLSESYFVREIPQNSFLKTPQFPKPSPEFSNQKFHLSIDVQTKIV